MAEPKSGKGRCIGKKAIRERRLSVEEKEGRLHEEPTERSESLIETLHQQHQKRQLTRDRSYSAGVIVFRGSEGDGGGSETDDSEQEELEFLSTKKKTSGKEQSKRKTSKGDTSYSSSDTEEEVRNRQRSASISSFPSKTASSSSNFQNASESTKANTNSSPRLFLHSNGSSSPRTLSSSSSSPRAKPASTPSSPRQHTQQQANFAGGDSSPRAPPSSPTLSKRLNSPRGGILVPTPNIVLSSDSAETLEMKAAAIYKVKEGLRSVPMQRGGGPISPSSTSSPSSTATNSSSSSSSSSTASSSSSSSGQGVRLGSPRTYLQIGGLSSSRGHKRSGGGKGRPSSSSSSSSSSDVRITQSYTEMNGLEVMYLDGREVIRAGSLGKIVEWMLKKAPDAFLLEVLVIAYRQFVSPLTFFNILLLHYPHRDGVKQGPAAQVELRRFLALLSLWIRKYLLRDFLVNNEKGARLFDSLWQFLAKLRNDGFLDEANQLKLLLIRTREAHSKKKRHSSSSSSSFSSTLSSSASQRSLFATSQNNNHNAQQPETNNDDDATPRTRARRDSREKRSSRGSVELIRTVSYSDLSVGAFAELAPLDVADEMTRIDFALFQRVKEREFLNLSWKDPNPNVAKNIKRIVERANRVSFWVATTIVTCRDLVARVSLLKRFLILAERCRELRNFNTLMVILGGLNLHPVSRLKRTWKMLPEKYLVLFARLEQLMENKQNYKNYREALKDTSEAEAPGTVPYIGVYLRDLVFIEEGNPTILENGLINFEKLLMIAKTIVEVQRFQREAYQLEPCRSRALEHYIKKLRGEDEKTLDTLSFACEPNRGSCSVSDIEEEEYAT
ncbi:hypothetical protein QOT17_008359 [Balamuthia mandrillaris]